MRVLSSSANGIQQHFGLNLMQAKTHSKDASLWRVELMRLTAFLSAVDVSDADKWWGTVIGEPPDSKTVKLKGATQTLEGHLGTGKVLLNVDVNRVDWLTAPDLSVEQEIKEIPNIGAYAEVASLFNSKMVQWLKCNPSITRLAWGATLTQPVEDRESGYKRLSNYLPALKIDPVGSSELFYQINRPRQSKVIPGLVINRFQKWSVMKVQRINVQVIPSQAQAMVGNVAPGFDGCRVEVDINSSGDRSELLPSDRLESLYMELVSIGTEIAAQGDIA